MSGRLYPKNDQLQNGFSKMEGHSLQIYNKLNKIMAPIVNGFIQRDIKKLRKQIGDEAITQYDRQISADHIQAIVNAYTDKVPYINNQQQFLGHTNWYLSSIEQDLQKLLAKQELENKFKQGEKEYQEKNKKQIKEEIKGEDNAEIIDKLNKIKEDNNLEIPFDFSKFFGEEDTNFMEEDEEDIDKTTIQKQSQNIEEEKEQEEQEEEKKEEEKKKEEKPIYESYKPKIFGKYKAHLDKEYPEYNKLTFLQNATNNKEILLTKNSGDYFGSLQPEKQAAIINYLDSIPNYSANIKKQLKLLSTIVKPIPKIQ